MPLIQYELEDQNYEESQQNKFLMKNLNCNSLPVGRVCWKVLIKKFITNNKYPNKRWQYPAKPQIVVANRD